MILLDEDSIPYNVSYLLWRHNAVPLHSLQYLQSLLWIHMADPPHCLQKARALLWTQMFFPLHSLHWFFCLSRIQILAPLHSLQQCFCLLLCGHVFLYVRFFFVVIVVVGVKACVMHTVGSVHVTLFRELFKCSDIWLRIWCVTDMYWQCVSDGDARKKYGH